jgi:hypothetical protein
MVFPPGFFGNYEEKRSRQAVNRFVQGFLKPVENQSIIQQLPSMNTEEFKKSNILFNNNENSKDYLEVVPQKNSE